MKTKFNINQFKPCNDAKKYYDACKSTKQAWNNCPRGDWMLWIAKKLNVDLKILTIAKAMCANTISHLMTDERSKNAIAISIAYGNGKATINELNAAAAAAAAAAYDAYDADAVYAAYAAYAAAADAAAAYVAKKENQLQTAEICKEVLTKAVFEKIKN